MANINNPNTADRTLESFKTRMSGGGARPNLFECELNFPADSLPTGSTADTLSNKTRFLVKAANLPASNLGIIDVPFRGRNLKIAGDRTFDPWTITVINDTGFEIRNAFERWMNLINNMSDNEGLSNPVDYQVDAFVDQLDRNGNTLKSYTLRGAYPTEVAAIDLSYSENDAVETFGVTFQYQYFETSTTT